MFGLRIPRMRLLTKTLSRGYATHNMPPLEKNFEDGIPDFLSKGAFDVCWTQYQSFMLYKLNQLLADTGETLKHPKDIALKYARDPNVAPIFNYASMAHNNHFFFRCLSDREHKIPEKVENDLVASFSSIETLQSEIIITATSMFGPGFVWLMKDRFRNYSLLTTYAAGSPYPQAHYRRQTTDMNTENTEDKTVAEHHQRMANDAPENSAGAWGPRSASKDIRTAPPGGLTQSVPVLCINTWEHAWLPDYGVGGKQEYATNWWRRIDWSVVATNAQLELRGFA